MKKLNKKGFTLIELLAVIVVLAIVMIIAVPTVLSSITNSRNQAFNASANSIASWFESQYSLCKADGVVLDNDGYSSTYKGLATSNCNLGATAEASAISSAEKANLFKEAGASLTDYSATVYFTNGRACVKLTAIDGGKFTAGNTAQSSGC